MMKVIFLVVQYSHGRIFNKGEIETRETRQEDNKIV